MTKYQAVYEGQILTDPMSLQGAINVAIEENIKAIPLGHLPICEVTIAPIACSQCIHFFKETAFDEYDGGCLFFMDHARSDDTIAIICKGYSA